MTQHRILELAANKAIDNIAYWENEYNNDPNETTWAGLKRAQAEYSDIQKILLTGDYYYNFKI